MRSRAIQHVPTAITIRSFAQQQSGRMDSDDGDLDIRGVGHAPRANDEDGSSDDADISNLEEKLEQISQMISAEDMPSGSASVSNSHLHASTSVNPSVHVSHSGVGGDDSGQAPFNLDGDTDGDLNVAHDLHFGQEAPQPPDSGSMHERLRSLQQRLTKDAVEGYGEHSDGMHVGMGEQLEQSTDSSAGEKTINSTLLEHGFSAVPLMENGEPNQEVLADRMSEILEDSDNQRQMLKEFLEQKDASMRGQDNTTSRISLLQRDNAKLIKALAEMENQAKNLQSQLSKQGTGNMDTLRQLKMDNKKIKHQLVHSEARVKAKEDMLQRMRERMEAEVMKEQAHRERDLELLRVAKQPRSRKSGESVETIQAYQTERANMDDEIKFLRKELRRVNDALRDESNSKMRCSDSNCGSSGSSRSSFDASPAPHARTQGGHERAVLAKLAKVQRQLEIERERHEELREENSNLRLEIDSRPSVQDWRTSQRRISFLERRLEEAEEVLNERSDAGRLRRHLHKSHPERNGGGVDTRELIARDKISHRLQLHRLEALPRETARQILQDACRELEVSDVSLIAPSIRKMAKVMEAVPRMEGFIRDVCSFVFMHHRGHLRNERSTLEDIVPALTQWLEDLRFVDQMKEFENAVTSELSQRSFSGNRASESKLSTGEVVTALRELIEFETDILGKKDMFGEADACIEQGPEVFLNRVVKHFCQLFGVKGMEGLFPKMNEVYLFVNEMENFLKVVRITLQLPPSASINACLATLRNLTSAQGHSRTPSPEAPPDDQPGSANYVVSKQGAGLTGVAQVREMDAVLRELQRMLGAATLHDILPRCSSLMAAAQ